MHFFFSNFKDAKARFWSLIRFFGLQNKTRKLNANTYPIYENNNPKCVSEMSCPLAGSSKVTQSRSQGGQHCVSFKRAWPIEYSYQIRTLFLVQARLNFVQMYKQKDRKMDSYKTICVQYMGKKSSALKTRNQSAERIFLKLWQNAKTFKFSHNKSVGWFIFINIST